METVPVTPTPSPRGYAGQAPLDRILSWSHSDVWIWATNNGVKCKSPIAFRKRFDVLFHRYGWLFWRLTGPTEASSDEYEITPRSMITHTKIFSDPRRLFSGGDRLPGPDFVWAMPTHRIHDDGTTSLRTEFADRWPVRQQLVVQMSPRKPQTNRDRIITPRSGAGENPGFVFRRMVVREIWKNAGLFVATAPSPKVGPKKGRKNSSLFNSFRKTAPRRRKTLTLYLSSSLSSSSSSVESW